MLGKQNKIVTRRDFLRTGAWYAALIAGGASLGMIAGRTNERYVWQIDPYKCTQCGRCADTCVIKPSATKCVHAYAMCGYCKICFGFFLPEPNELNAGAENQQCPTGAIQRAFVEDPYYQYMIDEKLCIGCGICVRGCAAFGNGSLFLQIRHDRCLNCNQCSIATACPTQAISRVPASRPYIIKDPKHAEDAS
jgi:electron transport complex protein RnfB